MLKTKKLKNHLSKGQHFKNVVLIIIKKLKVNLINVPKFLQNPPVQHAVVPLHECRV